MSNRSFLTVTIAALLLAVPAFAGGVDGQIYLGMLKINAELEASGSDYRLEMVEYLTAGDEAGNTVYFSNVGNKQLALDFVAGDPRRAFWSGSGAGDDITWATDLTQGDAGVGLAATQVAIANAMSTWQGVNCSTLPLRQVSAAGNIGFLEYLLSGGAAGSPIPAADVVQAGFGTAVDAILPPPVIAATFTLTFTGNPDIDNDGRQDVALREIYYTNNYAWSATGAGGIDIETVVLHETGHALSQAHFGKLFRTDSNGKFHFAPRAVMNAGYTGVQREIGETDNAGHCSNWSNWPNN